MKKNILLFLMVAMAGNVILSGCSKSKKTAASPESNAGSSTAAATPDGPVELKIKWAAGKKYSMRLEFNQGTEMNAPGQPEPVKQEVKMAQDFTFTAVNQLDNGGWQLELEFEQESMDVLQGGRSVLNFDTTQSPDMDTNNPVAPIMRAMVGARIQYFIDASGKVEKLGGVAELLNHIVATTKPRQQAMFKQMFSEDTLKQYGSFSETLPNRLVNIGESWSVKRDIGSAIGTLTVDMNYTFKNWELHGDRQCAHIVDTGNIYSKSVSAAMTGAAVEVESGKTSGDVWFDPELGMIVDVNTDQDMTMKITTRTATFRQQLNQKIRMKLVDVE